MAKEQEAIILGFNEKGREVAGEMAFSFIGGFLGVLLLFIGFISLFFSFKFGALLIIISIALLYFGNERYKKIENKT